MYGNSVCQLLSMNRHSLNVLLLTITESKGVNFFITFLITFLSIFQNIDNNLRCCVGELHCTDLGNRQNIVTLLSSQIRVRLVQ